MLIAAFVRRVCFIPLFLTTGWARQEKFRNTALGFYLSNIERFYRECVSITRVRSVDTGLAGLLGTAKTSSG